MEQFRNFVVKLQAGPARYGWLNLFAYLPETTHRAVIDAAVFVVRRKHCIAVRVVQFLFLFT